MLPPGHLSASYIIAKSGERKLSKFTKQEILFIVLCGFIFDLDFFVPYLFGYPGGVHHYFPTHTPLAGLIYFAILYLIFRNKFSKRTFVFAAITMLTHLIIDDFSYWMSLVGLEREVQPQIFWLYPFDARRNIAIQKALEISSQQKITNKDVLFSYVSGAPKLFMIEIIVTGIALYMLIKNKLTSKAK